jgi:hypothetical protein
MWKKLRSICAHKRGQVFVYSIRYICRILTKTEIYPEILVLVAVKFYENELELGVKGHILQI